MCLAQEHNTMSPARARTRTARSGVERTNHVSEDYFTKDLRKIAEVLPSIIDFKNPININLNIVSVDTC